MRLSMAWGAWRMAIFNTDSLRRDPNVHPAENTLDAPPPKPVGIACVGAPCSHPRTAGLSFPPRPAPPSSPHHIAPRAPRKWILFRMSSQAHAPAPAKLSRDRDSASKPKPGSLLLKATQVSKSYRDGDRTLEVLRGINLTLSRAEAVAIVGTSGAGKSTLLHILGALDRPTTGEVEMDGQSYAHLGDGALAELRARRVGFIYQFHHLLPEFSALENVLVPGLIARTPYREMEARALALLRAAGLGDRLHHRPSRLSGGEQQRVALARALMNNPDLVLADEPTGDLDQETGRAVIDLIWQQTVGQGRTFLIVTHDPAIARRANRILRLSNGQLTAETKGAEAK